MHRNFRRFKIVEPITPIPRILQYTPALTVASQIRNLLMNTATDHSILCLHLIYHTLQQ